MQNCTHNKIYDRAADGRHFKTYFDQEVIKIKYTGMSVRYQTAGPPKKSGPAQNTSRQSCHLSFSCAVRCARAKATLRGELRHGFAMLAQSFDRSTKKATGCFRSCGFFGGPAQN